MNNMRAFVSGQLSEFAKVRSLQSDLKKRGIQITHDWTRTDPIADKRRDRLEAGRRAALDITGIVDSDIYVLLTDNKTVGKGMYVELGASLALHETSGKPSIHVVGVMNHLSIFYLHPAIIHHESVSGFLDYVMSQNLLTA